MSLLDRIRESQLDTRQGYWQRPENRPRVSWRANSLAQAAENYIPYTDTDYCPMCQGPCFGVSDHA